MASIVFYENEVSVQANVSEANVKPRSGGRSQKPGCVNNMRQKTLLAAAGHSVWAKNLLNEKWTPMRLRPFFGELPVSQWFNPSASRIKSGALNPENMSEDEALLQMVNDPLLIRRPLMQVDNQCRAGFDQTEVDCWIGLQSALTAQDLETCPKGHLQQPCAEPAA